MFLSHSSADQAFTTKLASELRRHGIRSWYSEQHIIGSEQWHDAIGKALARCDWLIVILTPNAVASQWVKHEVLYAFRKKHLRTRVVPLMLKKCDPEKLSWALPNFQISPSAASSRWAASGFYGSGKSPTCADRSSPLPLYG